MESYELPPAYRSTCRACMLLNGSMKNIFNVSVDAVSVSDMLIYIAPIEVAQNDGLPESLCSTCFNKLTEAYKFQQLCVSSDGLYRNLLKSVAPSAAVVKSERDTPPLKIKLPKIQSVMSNYSQAAPTSNLPTTTPTPTSTAVTNKNSNDYGLKIVSGSVVSLFKKQTVAPVPVTTTAELSPVPNISIKLEVLDDSVSDEHSYKKIVSNPANKNNAMNLNPVKLLTDPCPLSPTDHSYSRAEKIAKPNESVSSTVLGTFTSPSSGNKLNLKGFFETAPPPSSNPVELVRSLNPVTSTPVSSPQQNISNASVSTSKVDLQLVKVEPMNVSSGSNKSKKFICTFCKNLYNTWEDLANHIGEHKIKSIYGNESGSGNSPQSIQSQPQPQPRNPLEVAGIPKHKCSFCDKMFGVKEELIKHMSIHIAETKNQIDSLKQTIKKPSLEEPESKKVKLEVASDFVMVEINDEESTENVTKKSPINSKEADISIDKEKRQEINPGEKETKKEAMDSSNATFDDSSIDKDPLSFDTTAEADTTGKEKDSSTISRQSKQRCHYCVSIQPSFSKMHRHVRDKHKDEYPEYVQELKDAGEELFICSKCPTVIYYLTLVALTKHMNIAHKEIADKESSYTTQLKNAIGVTDSSTTTHPCVICFKVFSSWTSLQKHQAIMHKRRERKPIGQDKSLNKDEQVFKCDICNKKFSKKGALDSHKQMHGNQAEEPSCKYYCVDCNPSRSKVFQSKAIFCEHMNTSHKEVIARRKTEIVDTTKSFCEFCFKTFRYTVRYKSHMAAHTSERFTKAENDNDEEEENEDDATKNEESAEEENNDDEQEEDEQEEEEEENEEDEDTKPDTYNCKYCSRTYLTPWTLSRHEDNCPDKSKKSPSGIRRNFVRCKLCNRAMGNFRSLQLHMEKSHSKASQSKASQSKASQSKAPANPPSPPKKPATTVTVAPTKVTPRSAAKVPAKNSAASLIAPSQIMHPCKLCSGIFGESSDLKKHYVESHDFDPSLFG